MVTWLLAFPQYYRDNYNEDYETYCNKMAQKGTPGTFRELQAAADLHFASIQVYTTASGLHPNFEVRPQRLEFLPKGTRLEQISLWYSKRVHCLALKGGETPIT